MKEKVIDRIVIRYPWYKPLKYIFRPPEECRVAFDNIGYDLVEEKDGLFGLTYFFEKTEESEERLRKRYADMVRFKMDLALMKGEIR